MLVTSSAYFVFLVAVFALYWPVARWRVVTLAVILAANVFFYAKWDVFYLGLIPGAALCDFFLALALGRAKRRWIRLLLVCSSLVLNLGLLAAFKYMPFFLETWAGITGGTAAKWAWTFPLGISFYAFQSLSYTNDLYRGHVQPVQSPHAYL